jgi:hypothetical protein
MRGVPRTEISHASQYQWEGKQNVIKFYHRGAKSSEKPPKRERLSGGK